MTSVCKSMVFAAGIAAAGFSANAAVPDGWLLVGSNAANYETDVDRGTIYNSRPSAYLKAKTDQEGDGSLMQLFPADPYVGKRVRFSGYVKSDIVTGWAGLWLLVDGKRETGILAFDNMQERPIKGTTEWRHYEVVLDVPAGAIRVALGILLDGGPGKVWLNSANVEVVSSDIPVTRQYIAAFPDNPQNQGLGWVRTGTNPANYEADVDRGAIYNARPSAYLKAKTDHEGSGSLEQEFSASPYVGKRVRFSAYVKSESVTRWAGLWMEVDGKRLTTLAIDNMRERPIRGTTEWKLYEVVLDVPENAVGIDLGILLDGPGQVWLSSERIEIVSSAIPVTKPSIAPSTLPDGPRNLRLGH